MVLDIIRKSLYAGIGAVVVTNEEIRKTVARFVEAGRMSVEDSEALIRELSAKGELQQEEFQQWLTEMLRTTGERLELANRKELEELTARVKILEERLALLEELRSREEKSS